jgi:DNA polymerase-1
VLQEIIDNCLVVYHNAKFDLVSLQTLGLDTVRGRFICTMVLAHLIDENRPFTGKGLDSCARYYLKDDKGKRKSDDLKLAIKCFGWGMLTPDLVCKYAVWDAVLTLQLFEHLQPMATAEQLAETWKHKKAFMLNLIEMEKTGIQVDQSLCEQMTEIGEKRMQEIRDELRLNPGSPKDLKVLLNDKLGLPPYISAKTGNPSFDKEAMKWYEDILSMTNNTTGRLILEYRGWQKSVSSNYKSYLTHLSPDGRLRPNYLMHGTLTGRLSCREPNLQQIPKTGDKPWNGKMKACFVAQPGYVLRSVDYSQLELRLATVYAQEPSLMAVFNEGRDIFTEMSKELEMSRNDTKTFVYSTQYGGGEKRISNVFGVPRERARELRQNYYATYPKFKAASDRIARACREEKKIRLWSGRYRHFLYPEDEAHKAFNSLCQGGGADIVERSITRLFDDGISDGSDCRVLLQIHDEVVAEVREDRVAYFDQAISESMARVDFHPKLTTVKFAAQAGLWGGK